MSLRLNVSLFLATSFLVIPQIISIGLSSQWYGGSRNTVWPHCCIILSAMYSFGGLCIFISLYKSGLSANGSKLMPLLSSQSIISCFFDEEVGVAVAGSTREWYVALSITMQDGAVRLGSKSD